MKTKMGMLGLILMLMFVPTAVVHAEGVTIPMQSVITPKADVIVTKYRDYHGVLQYRRWNETRGFWVDKEWITMN